jgi:hypothetical protein
MKSKMDRLWLLLAALLAAPLVVLSLNHAAEPAEPSAVSAA